MSSTRHRQQRGGDQSEAPKAEATRLAVVAAVASRLRGLFAKTRYSVVPRLTCRGVALVRCFDISETAALAVQRCMSIESKRRQVL
ncbi:hypothetical protein SIM67_04155 [Haloferax mediterranei ATCC 33500]|uniref:hypothetical protein n=1 Tax=Haloferax mediterranei TaxID=2252 RepID=UPI0012DCEBCB|nr:hypothetical protein [Haloferax mediterranei]MDX5987449.1 hypothetical protein [Haloferax mediterranei ATCC 33500]